MRTTDGRAFTGRRGAVGRAAGTAGLRVGTAALAAAGLVAAFFFAVGWVDLPAGVLRADPAPFFDALPRPLPPLVLLLAISSDPRLRSIGGQSCTKP
jgi:hypothetical protein